LHSRTKGVPERRQGENLLGSLHTPATSNIALGT
jgi:hypothetical protein